MIYDFTTDFVEPSIQIDAAGRVELRLTTDDGEITLLFLIPDFEDIIHEYYEGLDDGR